MADAISAKQIHSLDFPNIGSNLSALQRFCKERRHRASSEYALSAAASNSKIHWLTRFSFFKIERKQ
jgi:hypothetical protein